MFVGFIVRWKLKLGEIIMSYAKIFQGSNDDIEKIAQETLQTLKKYVPNTNSKHDFLQQSVKLLNGTISVAPMPAFYEVDGGSLIIYPDRKFKIQLSATTSPLRDNFTIAHELGHFFLHYDYDNPPDEEVIFARYGSGIYEFQANRFAAAFLMPKEEFIKIRKKYADNPFLIAAYFEVSIAAAETRMEYIK